MDKIKVNLNYKLYHLLIRDMEDFLFYKENKEINKNLFYNTIVIRMYERIIKQYQQKSMGKINYSKTFPGNSGLAPHLTGASPPTHRFRLYDLKAWEP